MTPRLTMEEQSLCLGCIMKVVCRLMLSLCPISEVVMRSTLLTWFRSLARKKFGIRIVVAHLCDQIRIRPELIVLRCAVPSQSSSRHQASNGIHT